MSCDESNISNFSYDDGLTNKPLDSHNSQKNFKHSNSNNDRFEKIKLDKAFIENAKKGKLFYPNKTKINKTYHETYNDTLEKNYSTRNNAVFFNEIDTVQNIDDNFHISEIADFSTSRMKGLSLSLLSLSILTFLSYSVYQIDQNPNYKLLSLSSYGLEITDKSFSTKKYKPILITSSISKKSDKQDFLNQTIISDLFDNKIISKGAKYYSRLNSEINSFLKSDLWVGRYQINSNRIEKKTIEQKNSYNSWMGFIKKRDDR